MRDSEESGEGEKRTGSDCFLSGGDTVEGPELGFQSVVFFLTGDSGATRKRDISNDAHFWIFPYRRTELLLDIAYTVKMSPRRFWVSWGKRGPSGVVGARRTRARGSLGFFAPEAGD